MQVEYFTLVKNTKIAIMTHTYLVSTTLSKTEFISEKFTRFLLLFTYKITRFFHILWKHS